MKQITHKKDLPQKRLKELLLYDPDAGTFTCLVSRSKWRVGNIAGTCGTRGYIQIRIDNKRYYAHRLAFLYMEGYFPEHQVDHINRIKSDNSWKNLRHVNNQCNTRNCSISKRNKSGIIGVCWNKRANKWQSDIKTNSDVKYLGLFKTLKEAVQARWDAEVKYGYPNCNTTSSAFLYLQKESNKSKKGSNMNKVDIIVDSGAFSVFTKGKVIDMDAYITYIKKWEKYLTAHIVLDVIGDAEGSMTNYKIMRDAGLNPIPIYHLHEPEEYLYEYMRMTDYIGVGGVASRMTARNNKILFDSFWKKVVDKNGLPKVKVHGMGITDVDVMTRYPWASLDSSTWLMTSRRGILIAPKFENGKPNPFKAKRIEVSTKSPHRQHYGQHIENLSKFQRDKLLGYIHSLGFKMGTSRRDKNGVTLNKENGREAIIEKGLSNNYIQRDYFNLNFFLELEKALPDWPWSWPNEKISQQLSVFDTPITTNDVPGRRFRKTRTRIYLAGEGVKEADTFEVVKSKGCVYRRMLSFPFRKVKGLKDIVPFFDQ